jgi:hypothetical protein
MKKTNVPYTPAFTLTLDKEIVSKADTRTIENINPDRSTFNNNRNADLSIPTTSPTTIIIQ